MLEITPDIVLQDWELTEHFTRSSGPGGQNVNKVSTAVELRFEAARSPHLSEPVKRRLQKIAGRKWTRDGAIIIRAEEARTQGRNRQIARDRLVEIIQRALISPKRRVATKPTFGSQQRRLKAKKIRSNVKGLRGSVSEGDT